MLAVATPLMMVLASPAHAQCGDCTVVYNGLANTTLGNAQLELGDKDTLLVTGLGSSGLDGVSVDLGGAESWGATVMQLPTAALPNGAFMKVAAYGGGSFGESSLFGTLVATDVGELLQLTFSFPGSDDSEVPYTAALLLNGELVDIASDIIGPAAVVDPKGCGSAGGPPRVTPPLWGPECTVIKFQAAAPIVVELVGREPVLANEIIALPQLPVPVPVAFSHLEITASNIPWLVVLNETATATPPGCAADLDGDGTVAGGDLGILLASWGQSGAADLDASGVVDAGDLATFLGAWGDCG